MGENRSVANGYFEVAVLSSLLKGLKAQPPECRLLEDW